MRTPLAFATALALAGCTLIPKYERPPLPVPAEFPAPSGAQAEAAQAAAGLGWQQYFADERLRQVIERSLAGNRDLRMAALRVEQAAALLRIQRSQYTPAIGAQAVGSSYRLPEKMGDNGEAKTVEQYTVEVGFLSWEIDLFGRLRSLSASALEQYLATEEGRKAAQISLVAGVAQSWLRLAADTEGLRIAEATVAAQTASRDLVQASRDAGVASDLDLSQADSQVESARASRAELAGAVDLDRHALELLVGAPLPAELLPEGLSALPGSPELAPGLPSEVLLARPDILAAEHRLLAANADIGVARAAFFPRISLTAALGTLSPDVSGLFGSGTRTWRYSPVIQAPIFAGGGLRANLQATKLEREIAVASYEKAIQSAFAEVADALTLRATLTEQREAWDRLLAALDTTLRLSEQRYRAGLDSYLQVLIAQQALYRAQQTSVQLELADRANQVALYKALGGGS